MIVEETHACIDTMFSLLRDERKAVVAFDVVAINDCVEAIDTQLETLKSRLALVQECKVKDASLAERTRELRQMLDRNDRLIRFAQSLTQLIASGQRKDSGRYDQHGVKLAASEPLFSRSV